MPQQIFGNIYKTDKQKSAKLSHGQSQLGTSIKSFVKYLKVILQTNLCHLHMQEYLTMAAMDTSFYINNRYIQYHLIVEF